MFPLNILFPIIKCQHLQANLCLSHLSKCFSLLSFFQGMKLSPEKNIVFLLHNDVIGHVITLQLALVKIAIVKIIKMLKFSRRQWVLTKLEINFEIQNLPPKTQALMCLR